MPIASDNHNQGDEALNKFSGKVKALKELSKESKIKNPPKSVSVAGNGNGKEAEEACPWTEGDIPMRKGNCKVLLIAPHGHPKDDEKTYEIARLAADKLNCYAIINQTFKKPPKKKDPKTGKIQLYKSGNPIRHEPNKKKKLINLNRIDQVHDHLESEFEKSLLNIVNNIIEKYGKALVLWIHGIDDENLTPENTDGNVDGIDALIGIGQGNPDHPTAYQRTVNKLVSALETNPLSPLNAALAEKGSNYCGWHENIMNQFLGAKGYSLDKVESIQIELRNIGFRQKDNFENTAMALENSLFAMAIRPATESEQPHLDSAVQKGSLRQIEAGKIDLDNDQFMSRLDHITSDKVKFNTLVASISKNGILNNIIVRRRSDANGRPYQLISGFRRMAAFQATIPEKDKFSNATVPARVLDESVSDDEAYRFSFTENLARQDLSLWEVARSCEKIRKELDDGNKQKGEIEEHLANLIQKNARTVRRYLRLASLDNETLTNAVHTDDISPTMALDLGSRELEADEIEALLSHVKNYPKTTRTFKRFYENLEYCCDLSKLSVAGVLKCKNVDSFLSLDRQDLEDRIAYLRNKSNKPDSEILQGKTGSLVKDVPEMEAEATNKSLQNRFVKTSERLSQKVSKAFEKSKIDAQFKIKPNLRSQKKMVALTISMPVDQIHKAIDVVSSEVANKFAVAPLIISASRRNDTPACHSEWFMEGLKRGYLGVSTGGSRYVLFEKARLIVFWTKNPEPMFKYLDEIDQKEIGYYFQYTLNDYKKEKLEPNIPPLEERIENFKTLSDKIGKEKVIWRFDPLLLADTITKEKLIDKERLVDKVENLMEQLTDYTEKLVISFYLSAEYKHALKKIQDNKIYPRDFKADDIAFVAKQLVALGKKHNMKVAACAEKGDLSLYGIGPNKCIDDELIKRVFKDDKILMSFLDSKKSLKHRIREGCECIASEDIGLINTCANGCLYCYANKKDEAVKKNLERIENGEIGEFLIPPKSPKKL